MKHPPNHSTDVAKLATLIKLPFAPTSTYFETALQDEATSPGASATDWMLTAVITFSDDDTERLAKSGTSQASPPPPSGSAVEKPWFSADIRKRLANKSRTYEASSFFKEPLSHGSVTHLEGTPTFVLVLYTSRA